MKTVHTRFEVHFDQILLIINQASECLEGSVERLNILKRLSAERVAEPRTVVDLNNVTILVQPDTIVK